MNELNRVSAATAVLVALLLLLGCAANMVTLPGTATNPASPYAPINEKSRSGVIKYLNQGARSIVDKRRDDAYKKMYEACGGRYRIDSEGPRVEGGSVVPVGDVSIFATTEYWYIEFSCVRSHPTRE